MNRYLRSEPVCNGWQLKLAVLLLLSTLSLSHGATLVQEFYLPMPESQIYQANNTIIAGTGSTIASTFSIVVTGSGTIIYYDQWEDGYETDLSHPAQSTTQIWGDGNDAHGIPPGFAHNPVGLPAGTVITLTNNVTLPRNPSTIFWDGRDRVAANKALIVARAGWPIPTGPVFAGAASVLSTIDFGTNYISPVGQNLTNNLFRYVGMFIMAAQNNTVVTIDLNGTGVGTTNVVLNQGESYLVNGGILKGGRVTSTKLVQADLIIGHVGASYASDWFTLYPASAWSSSYYTPVGSASRLTQPAYVYLYNSGSSAITINYTTKVGSGSFSVPGTNGVYQFQMPVGSGASFVNAGGQNFYALCTVAANNASDTAYNWGFTLVPQSALTTEATVGWGPGSADGTVNGSPVWVTALGNTTIYVDYKGDHLGALTDPSGNKYDTNFTVTVLQSQKIFDPSKNQTGMRIYTVDGTLLTAAWGEDPDVAASGNPYIDAGMTVLPFPVPVVKKSALIVTDTPPASLSVGDTIQYTVQVDNKGLLPLGNTVVIDAPSGNLTYVPNTTTFDGNPIPDNLSGTNFPLSAPGYTIPVILSRGTSTFTYLAQVNAGGVVSNSVNIGGTTISAQTAIPPAPTNGASVFLHFTDSGGVTVGAYSVGANVYVTMTNAVGNTSSNSVQTISVTVVDTNTLDLQTITLTETGVNTGVFRNLSALPTSGTSGLGQQDGTLNVTPGDTLSVSYTDPNFGDSDSATATISIPTPNKQLYLSVNNSTNGTQALNRIDPVAYAHGPVHTSIDIGQGGGGGTTVSATIGIDGTFSTNKATSPVIFNYTTGSGSNRLMLITVGVQNSTGSGPSVSGVSYNGTNLPLIASAVKGGANPKYSVAVYALTNPLAGSGSVQVTWGGGDSCIVGVNTFTNVNQATPFNSTNTAAPGASITVNSATNQLVYGTIYHTAAESLAAGQNATVRWTTNFSSSYFSMGCTTVGSNSPTTTMTWTASAYAIGVSINPATTFIPSPGGGPATNVTSFAQTPVFAAPFTMPAGGQVTITNFIAMTNGTLTSGSAVSATLRTNGVNFLTLTNPIYNAAGGITNLVWSGTLATNITIPAGVAITYVISNNVANSAFHVNYDSTNARSVIVLPATTVIQVNALGIYDAPFPNGSLVNTPVAGSTVYVRAQVSDPFGSYDITSLGLVITGVSGLTNTLTGANVVTNDALSKIYEYAWTTGSTPGGYNIAVTANEGTEGVTATATASLTTTFLDLGTPSTTVFTAGANGIVTNSYGGGGVVSVRLSDLNRNTNSTTLETVSITVMSSTGDSETFTLVETGVDTGIFTNSINASTNIVGTSNNGTLYAPVGSILTASYVDTTDASDTSSATATVQPAPGIPGVVINKTILSPAGGQTGVGQAVTYNLQVINTGSTTLPNFSITDTFPAAQLGYTNASLTPNTISSGSLAWTNLGSLTPGQSTNLTVTFVTLTTGVATNSATANGSTATNTSSVNLLVNNAAVNVTKILLAPTNQPVAVGSNVTFRITIQNVGNTTINYLPMEDTFSGAYYQYVSSTITNNGSGAGSLIWTNLASPVALATNAIITNDVTMLVVGQGNPANNTAMVDFATDIFGNAVPASSSTIGVNTAAASITGHVYFDINQSGVYTNGDYGLGAVSLRLFTDPNGDGDPGDGVLVQLTTTDVNGYYELLNLNFGHYVVIATPLPGYICNTPPNGRLPLNLTSLSASTNNFFFQYLPDVSAYSTVSGSVWYDTNGNATNDLSETNLVNIEIDLVADANTNGTADNGETITASTLTDANGNYSFAGVTPGNYVIHEINLYGYYNTGNGDQLRFSSTNGVVSTNNNFYNRPPPVAVNDTNSAYNLSPTIIAPLINDLSPNGDALMITNASSPDGLVIINAGSTNLTFTPSHTGTGTITYTISDGHGGTSTATITVNVTELADLGIGKTAPASVLAMSNLTYTISVTNFGPSPANSVVVTDALPSSVSFVSASSGGVNNGGMVNWSLGTLTNNQIASVTVTVTAPASGTLTNTASVSSPTSDTNTLNNSTPPVITSVTPVANLTIGKVGPAAVFAASNLTYTISVTNLGPSSASGVIVTDALPLGVTFVNASGNGTNVGGVVTWGLGTLTSNQVSSVTVTVTAPVSGSLTNTATVTSPTVDPMPTNNITPPVTTTVTPLADVSVAKVGPAGIIFGTNYNYTITVSNGGPSTATSLSVTDSLPNGLIFVSSVPSTTTNASNQVIWNLGDLAANVASNLTLTVISTQRGQLTNTASAGSPTGDPIPTNNVTPPVVTSVTNFPPLANPDTASMTENTTSTLSPLLNDVVRTPGGSLTIISTGSTNGTANISGTNITFTPMANFIGIAIVNYTITDNVGGTNSSFITVTVTNIPPLANPDSGSMTENSTNTFSPLGNDSVQTLGGVLSVVNASTTNGIVSFTATTVTFTPANNFIGTTLLHYTITDGIGGTNSSTITVTVTNIPPVANPDSFSMAQNTTNIFSPLGNDVVLTPGGTLSLTGVTTTNGSANINGTNVVFAPASGFLGTVTLGYTITDGIGGTNNSTITVTVTNIAPTALAQTVTTTENTALPINLTGSDPASRPLTFIIASPAAHGTLTGLNTNTGAVTYTPTNNFTGTDTFTFHVNNGFGDSSNATITVNVTPVADLLIVQSGPATGVAGSNLTYTVAVTNLGPSSTTNVLVTNSLAAGFTFVNASAGGVNAGSLVTWSLPILAANTGTNLTVTVFATDTGTFTNRASGSSLTPDLNPTNNDGSLTNALARTTVSALADVIVFKTGGTNVYAGGVLTYTITATNSGPSAASNVVVVDSLPAGTTFQSASGSYTVSNNVVTWAAVNLTNTASVNFTISLTAPLSGAFTNLAFSTAATADPVASNNNGSAGQSRVATQVLPSADLIVFLTGATSAVQGSNFVYSLTLSNAGPSVASNAVASDNLPTNLVFVSASGGGIFTTGVVTWPKVAALAVGGTTNYSITVYSPLVGVFTNIASAVALTFDPNSTNNSGVAPASQVQTTVFAPQFGILAGRPIFNPQTGLYEETVIVTNTGTGTVAGFQLYVTVLTPNVYLWNATGTNSGGAYVQYNFPVDPSGTASMILEFYNPSRVVFTNTLRAVAIIPADTGTTSTNGSVAVTKVFSDTRTNGMGFVIEFSSIPGKTYTILYSTNLTSSVWKVATPSVTASANVTQWYDDGPPKTESLPASAPARYYRIIKN